MSHSKADHTVLITGAGGSLGGEIMRRLSEKEQFHIMALTSQKEKVLQCVPHADRVSCFSIQEWAGGMLPLKSVNTVIHCAFSTSSSGFELSRSLRFTNDVFRKAAENRVSAIINISSRSLYGQNEETPWTEQSPISPESPYAMAKYAGEILAENVSVHSRKNTVATSLRLASLVGERYEKRTLLKFIRKAIDGDPITIIGGSQRFSYLDVRDAAAGIEALLGTGSNRWKEVYNLGHPHTCHLLELAALVAEIAKMFKTPPVKIVFQEKDVMRIDGMDSSLFYNATSWKPEYDMRATTVFLFECLLGESRGELHPEKGTLS